MKKPNTYPFTGFRGVTDEADQAISKRRNRQVAAAMGVMLTAVTALGVYVDRTEFNGTLTNPVVTGAENVGHQVRLAVHDAAEWLADITADH